VKPDGIGILGSGSDYTAFLDHFGIPSLDFSFSKKTTYGQYHSIYDSFAWMDRYVGYDGKVGSSLDSRLLLKNLGAPGAPTLHLRDRATGSYCTRSGLDEIHLLPRTAKGWTRRKKFGTGSESYKEAAAILQFHCSDTTTLPDEAAGNEKIGVTERHFLLKEGLPKRL
jgi:hypothetical protein